MPQGTPCGSFRYQLVNITRAYPLCAACSSPARSSQDYPRVLHRVYLALYAVLALMRTVSHWHHMAAVARRQGPSI